MRARSLAWSMDPNAFLKSMYVKYIFLVVSFTSFRVAMMVWFCLVVLRCGRNLSSLKWSSLCYSP